MVTGTHNLWRLNIDEYCHYGFIVWRHPSVESMSQKALKGYRDHNYKTTTNLATFLTCQVRQGLTPRVEIASDEERKRDGFQSMKLRWGNAKRHRTPSHRNLTQNCLDHILVQTFWSFWFNIVWFSVDSVDSTVLPVLGARVRCC